MNTWYTEAAKKREEEWIVWSAAAKAQLKYAYIQTSSRRYRIIMYDGSGRCGDGDEQWAQSKFVFVTASMNYSDMITLLRRLVIGDKTALESIEGMDH